MKPRLSEMVSSREDSISVGRANLPATPGWVFLQDLVRKGLIDATAGETFIKERGGRLRDVGEEKMGIALLQAGLLTSYQWNRLLTRQDHGLVMGNYRVLDELGKGGMGVVYKAEHRLMKRRVAVKVLPADEDCPASVRQRFFGEMRVLAELSHPHVVQAIDAGELTGADGQANLLYLVTELVDGGDLEKHVLRQGLCSVSEACSFVRQAAAGLQAAHDRHLIHRDIKPSNLLLTSAGQVKLVDFGLARQFSSRLTDPRALLGSVDFMAPEQSHDPSAVGKEADIYGLGATLFWLLTGEAPHAHEEHIGVALRNLQQLPPRRLRSLRPEMPAELDELVAKMLSRNPTARPSSPLAVMNALRPFVRDSRPGLAAAEVGQVESGPRVLVVQEGSHSPMRWLLERIGCACAEAVGSEAALAEVARNSYDLVFLDLALSARDEGELCEELRRRSGKGALQVIVVGSDPAGSLLYGADDYLARPIVPRQVAAKVGRAVEWKKLQDRAAELAEQLVQVNRQLERSVEVRGAAVRAAHDALLFTVARIAESRDGETAGHLRRMQAYTRVLALEAARGRPWQGLVDDRFLEQLERCVPLHDIGKIGLPDEILLKPASLSRGERATVETHSLIGDQLLEALGKEHGAGLDFLGTARGIVRSHHERWDGKGYPDGLVGEATPPAARLVAVADVYDALRRMRLYKPAISHSGAIRQMTERSPGQFDPTLVQALLRCHTEFERIYRELED